MYFKKSAPEIAPATSSVTSSGTVLICSALDHDERSSSVSVFPPATSSADVEPIRVREVPSAEQEQARKATAASNVVAMKPAAQRRQSAYLIPYARLRKLFGFQCDDDQSVVLSSDQLTQVTRMLLRAVHVDEEWYGRQYPDVKEAIAKGVFRSAKHHFIESGYFEGRRPAPVAVDEQWYARAYPDVGESVEFGELGSCQEHFDRYGESEGRLPAED